MDTLSEQQQQQQLLSRLMLSCDNCRKKKIRCNGGKPVCSSCQKNGAICHYSPVGPRKKPRRPVGGTAQAAHTAVDVKTQRRQGARENHHQQTGMTSDPDPADEATMGTSTQTAGHRAKRRASSLQIQVADNDGEAAGISSVSHLMLERLREVEAAAGVSGSGSGSSEPTAATAADRRMPVMEMLRLQTQISGLVDQLRNLTIHHASGMAPQAAAAAGDRHGADSPDVDADTDADTHMSPDDTPSVQCQKTRESLPNAQTAAGGPHQPRGINISRDLINHLIAVYFQYGHPAETGMYPIELYKDRLERAQVSEPFLLSVLAVASRFSDDPRVIREPAYLSGYDFFERVTRSLMMDVLERDCVENMLTLNNLAIYAVGLPVANRGWYFSGMAMRMATQMSLQKVDAPGRMPGASMMSGPGIESARRAFWTTLLLEALASFASGEPPPITIQDIHVAEPYDAPTMLADDSALVPDPPSKPAGTSSGSGAAATANNNTSSSNRSSSSSTSSTKETSGKGAQPNVCAYIAQLAMLLVRVARLNGNRHPESAQFSPEYAALHAEMVGWYHGLPDSMQIRLSTAKDEIARDPQLFGAKMFVHCHYHAAIIALHQPRVDLVRVESTASGFQESESSGQQQQQSQQNQRRESAGALRPRYSNHRSTGPPDQQSWRQLAQQQCLTAACTMTELLTLARGLDVRYHIVTFGFAVFMAGVVHVGAVAYTPRDSTERQYSINCVKEHVR
ncbi:hypothetical protein GGI11_004709, partial [Coemansia sp. RSA 2049]